jgi:hypothetical protein
MTVKKTTAEAPQAVETDEVTSADVVNLDQARKPSLNDVMGEDELTAIRKEYDGEGYLLPSKDTEFVARIEELIEAGKPYAALDQDIPARLYRLKQTRYALFRRARDAFKRRPGMSGMTSDFDEIVKKAGQRCRTVNDAEEAVHRRGLPTYDEAVAAAVAHYNQSCALLRMSGRVYVADFSDSERPELMTVSDARQWFRYDKVRYGHYNASNGQVHEKTAKRFELWLEDDRQKRYSRITFDPTTTDKVLPDNSYNLWNGFQVAPEPGDTSAIHDYIFRVICCENREHYEVVLDWVANLFQQPSPEHKPKFALVLRSPGEGTGKGTFVSHLLAPILGDAFVRLGKPDEFLNRFNTLMQGRLLAFPDEAFWAGDKAGQGTLYGYITETTVNIEAKNKDPYTLPFPTRFIMASNKDWVVPAGKDSRRFFVLDVSEEFKQDREYFGWLRQKIDEQRAAFLHEMLNREIRPERLNTPPVTSALVEQRLHTMDPAVRWWHAVLQEGGFDATTASRAGLEPGWPTALTHERIREVFLAWCRREGIRNPTSEQTFMPLVGGSDRYHNAVGKDRPSPPMCPSLGRRRKIQDPVSGKRMYGRIFPELGQARADFEAYMNAVFDWPEDDGDEAEMVDVLPEDPGFEH